MASVNLLFDEIDHFQLDTVIVQPVDPRDTARADTVDFHQFAGNDIDTHEIKPIGDQLFFDDLTDLPFPSRHPVGEHLAAGMDIGAKVPFFGLPAHGTDNFAVEQQNSNIPVLLDAFQVFLHHDRFPPSVGFVGPHVIVDQGVQVHPVPSAHLDHAFSAESLQGFDHHGPSEIVDDFAQAGGVPGHMRLGDDLRKIEDIEFAVAQDLAGGAVKDENVVVDRLQKLHGLVVERRIAAQKQRIEFGNGFENKMVLLGAADDRLVCKRLQAPCFSCF